MVLGEPIATATTGESVSAHPLPSDTKASAFLDIGTNSVRLLVVGITANKSYKVLHKEKVMVRLGDRGLIDQMIQREAMDRAILVCGKLVEVAQRFGAEEIVAVATSATREAVNQAEFLQRLEEEAHVNVRVVSGLEEARLIYLGVSRNVHLEDETALMIDIGGGSTEVIVGDAHSHRYMSSLQLGAIRLTNLFFTEDADTLVVATNTPARMAKGAVQELRDRGIKVGLFRPITVWPFPIDLIKPVVEQVKRIVVVEASPGQLEDELRLALSKAGIQPPPIDHVRHYGGILPQQAEIVEMVLSGEEVAR